MQKSRQFESFVADLYKKLGKHNIKQNVWCTKDNIRREFDITYGIIIAGIHITSVGYLECKYKKKNKVTGPEILEFYGKLNLFNINPKYASIITNSYFMDSAKKEAKRYNISTIDRKCLQKLYKKTLSITQRFRVKSLEKAINIY